MVALASNRGVFYYGTVKQSECTNTPQLYLKLLKELMHTTELRYHWFYFVVCLLGLVGHNFLYCILVSVAIFRFALGSLSQL